MKSMSKGHKDKDFFCEHTEGNFVALSSGFSGQNLLS